MGCIAQFYWFNLKLLSDIEPYHFFENTLRNGISLIGKDCSEAKNELLKSYRLIIYMSTLWCNFSILKHLIGLIQEILIKAIILTVPPIVCFLEVDLNYLDEFLDLHDYPLPGERIKVTQEMLLKYQLPFKKDNNFSRRKIKKIIPNLGPIKENTNSTVKT